MSAAVLILLWLHVIGACVLIGVGAGIAFFMVMAHRSRDASIIAHVATTVVVADFIFTAIAIALQPVTGLLLAHIVGWPLAALWIRGSLALYVLVGLFWLPVVFIQTRLRDLARAAARAGTALPALYNRLFRIWVICGFPAFFAVLGVLWLMLAKPM